MKKYRYILIIFFSAFLFASCEKETEGVSRVTYYCELNLKDGAILAIAKGSTYTDPGYIALENEEDVSDKVNVSGTVNTAAEGSYTLTYTINNAEGFPTTKSRLVIVYDNSNLNTTNIEGKYNSTVLRDGSPLPAAQQLVAPPWGIDIVKMQEGVYHVSDLLGGWYAIGRNYGPTYAGEGVIMVKSDNTIRILWSKIAGWGTYVQLAGTSSSYNPATKTLTLSTKMSDAAYIFLSTMVIQ